MAIITEIGDGVRTQFSTPVQTLQATVTVNGVAATVSSQTAFGVTLVAPPTKGALVSITYIPVVADKQASRTTTNNRAVIIGSSSGSKNSLVNGVTTGLFVDSSDEGYVNWIQAYHRNMFEVVGNFAVAGTFSKDAMAQLEQALLLKPRFVFIATGNNDTSATSPVYTAADTIKNLAALFDACLEAGVIAIMNSLHAFASPPAGAADKQIEINDYIRKEAVRRSNLIVLDAWKTHADILSSTGASKADANQADGIHGTAKAWRAMAALVRAEGILAGRVQDIRPRIASARDTQANRSTSRNVTTNPFMQTPVAATGTGMSGNVPNLAGVARVTGAATVVSSVAARADGQGNDWKCACTFTAAADVIQMSMGPEHTRLAAGRVYRASALVSAANMANIKGVHLTLDFTYTVDGVAINNTRTCLKPSSVTVGQFDQSAFTDLEFMTQGFRIPANAASISKARLRLQVDPIGAGSGDFTMAVANIEDITDLI